MENTRNLFLSLFLMIVLTSSAVAAGPAFDHSSLNDSMQAFAQPSYGNASNNSSNMATPQSTKNLLSVSNNSSSSVTTDLDKIMADLSSSDKPEDKATLAYIWGYPLITMQRSFDYFTSPQVSVLGGGPANNIHFARELVNATFKDVVSPNADTLYGIAWLDLKKEPLVLKVPPVADGRYYTFEFLDAYTNDYAYVGTRATGSAGGTYLIAGPQWNGQVPDGMTKIWTPTNLAWILQRTLVKGPQDVPNVHAIQDKISLTPLSAYQGNATTTTPTPLSANASANGAPVSPAPALIATTGIKIYDEIGRAMSGNPLNPPDPVLVGKLASIGIGPGKAPSTEANDTTKAALQTGIAEGEKLIDAKVANVGEKVNGWLVNAQPGVYGTDYLFRAAITKLGFGANIGQEALYPATFTDIQGQPLNGANNYTIHFDPGQTPPVQAFWSITMYNNKSLFVDNPINRYAVGMFTEGLKNNTDGSLDIYVQNKNPGPERESNWLPAPQDSFNLILRMYLPDQQVLDGTWSPPPVESTSG